MRFWKLFKRRETLGFKDVSKEIRREIRAIKKIRDEDERLERFQTLRDSVDKVMSNGDIKSAVGRPDKDKDGFLYYLSPSTIAVGLGVIVVPTLIGNGIPFLTPIITPLLAGAAGLAAVTAFIGHKLLYRRRAKELGLTVTDVKYAHKMKVQQTRVHRAAKALEVDDAVEESLKELRSSFTASAAKAQRSRSRRQAARTAATAERSAPPAP